MFLRCDVVAAVDSRVELASCQDRNSRLGCVLGKFIGIDPVRECEPQIIAAFRHQHRDLRQIATESRHHVVAMKPIGTLDVRRVSGEIARLAPLDDDPLGERRAAAVRLELDHAGEKIRRSGDPTDPDTGRQQLRKRAEVQHVLVAVEGLQARLGSALEAHSPIRRVLDHIHAVSRRKLEQRFAPAARHGDARRVVEIRDVIDEFRDLPPVPREPVQGCRELVGVQSFVVLSDLDEVGVEALKDRDGSEVGRRGHDDGVTFVEQQAADELDALLRPIGDEDLARRHIGAVRVHCAGNPFPKVGETGADSVLQRLVTIRRERLFCRCGEIGKEGREAMTGVERNGVVMTRRRHRRRQTRCATRQGNLLHLRPLLNPLGPYILSAMSSRVNSSGSMYVKIMAVERCWHTGLAVAPGRIEQPAYALCERCRK